MDGYQNEAPADVARADTSGRIIAIPRPSRRAIIVLGMSRSGTSLTANVLQALGAALPQDLMGAGHGNPLGHFEPRGVVELNDRILASVGLRWNDPHAIPERWFRSRPAYEFLGQITTQISRSYGDAPLLVIKDPRLCRLLPLYIDALDVLDIEPLVILQMRPVAEVVQSLVDRDDMRPDLAEFLWLRSVVEGEWHSRTCRRVWVSMRDMVTDWPQAIGRVAEALRLAWPVDPHGAAREIASQLKPRLCHGVMPGSHDAEARPFCGQAWAAAECGLAGDDAGARAGFDTVRGALHDLDRIYEPYLSELAVMRSSRSWRATAPLRSLRRMAPWG